MGNVIQNAKQATASFLSHILTIQRFSGRTDATVPAPWAPDRIWSITLVRLMTDMTVRGPIDTGSSRSPRREHAPEIVAHERAIRRTMIASSRWGRHVLECIRRCTLVRIKTSWVRYRSAMDLIFLWKLYLSSKERGKRFVRIRSVYLASTWFLSS